MLFRRTQPAVSPAGLQLVVGLGNIGAQYTGTQHNIGFEVVDELARLHHAHLRKGKFKGAEASIVIEGRRVLLLEPHTYMNLSGESVLAASRFYKLLPSQILVVCDDMYLPVGRIRLRAKGSDGGHNGLWSIINRLGTQDFPRLRIGVGEPPAGMDGADYVLSRFTSAERPAMNDARERAVHAVETWALEGIDAAMNKWNG